METANEFAMEEFLDLDFIHQHPNVVKGAIVTKGVSIGSALRLLITRWQLKVGPTVYNNCLKRKAPYPR